MLVTLLVKFRNKDCKTTDLGLLLQVLLVRIVTFVETLGSHLKEKGRDCRFIFPLLLIIDYFLSHIHRKPRTLAVATKESFFIKCEV